MSRLLPLRATGAVSRRRGKVLVGPVDLEIDGAGATVVIGPNGSGKSTLLALLHGTTRLNAGSVTWSVGLEDARAQQAFVFQRPVMLRRTVLGNIAYPLEMRGDRHARKTATDWAARVGLGEMLDRPASRLSGGEQQKLALARALVTAPQVLFLDEPCAALDARATREIEEILGGAKAQGTKLILATHDMGQARRMADDVVFLLRGRVHERGPDLLSAPQTPEARAFLNGEIVE